MTYMAFICVNPTIIKPVCIIIFTIKNRMVVLRWWAEKMGNPGAIMSDENLVLERLIAPTPDAGLVVSEFPES